MSHPSGGPRWGRLATLRLFLSYQRYSVLLLCIGVAGGCAGLFFVDNLLGSSHMLWQLGAALIVLLVASAPIRFGIAVGRKWPRKLRATRLASRRIELGLFSVKSIEGYCEDPCFRVVASEILARSGLPRSERRSIIRNFSDEARKPAFVMFVGPASETIRVEGALFETSRE